MRSLVTRLTVLEQLTAIIVIVAFGLTSLVITTQVLRAERRTFVTETSKRLAASFDDELREDPDTQAAAQSVVDDGLQAGVQIEVHDPAGRLMASSRTPPRVGQGSARAPRSVRPSEEFLASASSRGGYRVTAVVSDASRQTSLSALGLSLVIAALPILALSLLLGRSVVARALRPLSIMAERAAGLSVERNPRSLGAQSGLEEIDRLAKSFDHLLGRLDDALRAERRLTADASHELRTPLTVLGGELELLLEQAPKGAPASLALERAAEQVAAMRELVEAILLLHRSGEVGPSGGVDFEVLNLCDLARETWAESRLRYPGRESDVTLVAPDEILVSGQTALLASAVRNLLDNALKFTSPGHKVRVEVAETASQAVLTVDDQGPGVPEGERERVFDPFYRGAEARAGAGGFGLGLPILRRVARAHGGDAELLPSPLGGARFVVRLPRFEGADSGRAVTTRGPRA